MAPRLASKNGRSNSDRKSSTKARPTRDNDSNPLVMSRSQLKHKIRGIERLLKNKASEIHATVRLDNERKLAALKFQLEQSTFNEKERKYAIMYRKVKFFERQKVTRKLKKVKKELESNPENEELKAELKDLELDLCYVTHYPKSEKYISLFPTTTVTDPAVIAKQAEIRSHISSLIESGVIVPEIIEERVLQDNKEKKKTKGKKAKEGEEKKTSLGLAARGIVSLNDIAQEPVMIDDDAMPGDVTDLKRKKAMSDGDSEASDIAVEISSDSQPKKKVKTEKLKKEKTPISKYVINSQSQTESTISTLPSIEFEAAPLKDDFFLFDDDDDDSTNTEAATPQNRKPLKSTKPKLNSSNSQSKSQSKPDKAKRNDKTLSNQQKNKPQSKANTKKRQQVHSNPQSKTMSPSPDQESMSAELATSASNSAKPSSHSFLLNESPHDSNSDSGSDSENEMGSTKSNIPMKNNYSSDSDTDSE
ncbi:hypothetical protein BKA69DRAFT_712898 [Paraphysoderma sedebokerense]|nr:hypothetical protein BKA69DRAFT_712898 [Paraphysoderma sedebokerense]